MKPRVLYVGDSIARMNSIKNVLEDQGYVIWTAREVGDALRMLRALDFEAMIVEQHLMEVDREQFSRIKMLSPNLHVLSVVEGPGLYPGDLDLQNALWELERIMDRETSKV